MNTAFSLFVMLVVRTNQLPLGGLLSLSLFSHIHSYYCLIIKLNLLSLSFLRISSILGGGGGHCSDDHGGDGHC